MKKDAMPWQSQLWREADGPWPPNLASKVSIVGYFDSDLETIMYSLATIMQGCIIFIQPLQGCVSIKG